MSARYLFFSRREYANHPLHAAMSSNGMWQQMYRLDEVTEAGKQFGLSVGDCVAPSFAAESPTNDTGWSDAVIIGRGVWSHMGERILSSHSALPIDAVRLVIEPKDR